MEWRRSGVLIHDMTINADLCCVEGTHGRHYARRPSGPSSYAAVITIAEVEKLLACQIMFTEFVETHTKK